MNFEVLENRINYIEDGEILATVEFSLIGDKVYDINHTFVDPKLRGRKIGEKLVLLAQEEILKRNCNVVASCSFANKILNGE